MLAESTLQARVKETIRLIHDFPEPGIQFQDIGPVLADAQLFHDIITELESRYVSKGVDAIVGLEARGFVFGAALAYALRVPFVPMRKRGKLPGETFSVTYQKEYGTDHFEIQAGMLDGKTNVVIIDDILATGGTAEGACQLIRQAKAEVLEVACLLEIPALNGRGAVSAPVHIIVQ